MRMLKGNLSSWQTSLLHKKNRYEGGEYNAQCRVHNTCQSLLASSRLLGMSQTPSNLGVLCTMTYHLLNLPPTGHSLRPRLSGSPRLHPRQLLALCPHMGSAPLSLTQKHRALPRERRSCRKMRTHHRLECMTPHRSQRRRFLSFLKSGHRKLCRLLPGVHHRILFLKPSMLSPPPTS